MTLNHLESNSRMSQAVIANGFVFLAGQVATDPEGTIQDQTRQALAQIDRLLAASATDKSRILSATVFLARIQDYAGMNSVWDEWIAHTAPPARATVEAKLADPRLLVEIVIIALGGQAAR